mmetsp:Transcript_10449/g.24342  ORF Transcript_10449/g.24342 Transcript_10449/m.24342 type:complete len:485 (-) Transcript_10449:138-1592(-)|eukprot:CAMPEP_0182574980 /NCGR_PEP_ID=MMETSP1324-20130603/28202_1 /TAXON_ID=236786 /ORGANISM="Florenciella sp., Strain RCC1587" /LENGTH=484 /DNA_ID=CAMNT_0024790479 /DNA_START=115 /DNA_END=1569 /DNA_ORIENTATION=+
MPRKKPKDMVAVEVGQGEMDGVEPTTAKEKGTWETFMELEGIEDPKKKKKKKKKAGFLPTLVKQVMSIPAQYAKAEEEKRKKKGPKQYRKKAEFELNLHNPEHEEAWEYLEKLQMSKHDADLVFSAFRQIDIDDSGSISRREFYSWSGLEKSAFTEAIFKVLDADDSGEVDFKEFSLVLWNYLSFSPSTLAVFAYGLADEDDSGILEKKEVVALIKLVYGRDYETNSRLKSALRHLRLDEEGEVTKFEFIDMAKLQPLLLYPAYLAQGLLRERVVGNAFWYHISRERQRNFPGSADIWKILNEDNPWANFSGVEGGAVATKHVPEALKKYCPTKFTRDDYISYKQAELDGARQMRVELAKEEFKHLERDQVHHRAAEFKEHIVDAKHNYTSNDLENAMLVADENMVRQHTPPPINDEPAWKTRGKILMARYDRDQGRKKLKDKRSRGKAYDKKGKGESYVLAMATGNLDRRFSGRLPSVNVRDL